jgi:large subunit ribosomal protein L24
MKIRVDDTVEIIAGDDRGVRGRVLSVDHESGRLVVEGANRVFKHVRRSQKNPQGGRLSKEMPVRSSNVMLVCTHCSKPTRTGARYDDEGGKHRFCRACGQSLGVLAPPKTAYAKK